MKRQRDKDAPDPGKRLRSGGTSTRWSLVAIILLLIVALVQWNSTRRDIEPPLVTPTPVLTGSGAVSLFVEPDDGRAPVISEIDGAREAIALEIYLLSDEETIEALERARLRGVHVRVLLEEDPFGGSGNQDEIFARLERGGILVRWNNPTFRFSHIKTMIVDGHAALIMNQNLSDSSFTRNREFGVLTTRPREVAQAVAIFEADWNRTAEPADGPLIVSPTTSRQDMLDLIVTARRSIDIYAEVMRDREVVEALKAAAGRGVRVRLIMTGSRDGSDDNGIERAELRAVGVETRLARGGLYIHAKMVLTDEARAFVGSQNFTATSLDQNRELGVLLTDQPSLSRLARIFAEDFAEGQEEEVP